MTTKNSRLRYWQTTIQTAWKRCALWFTQDPGEQAEQAQETIEAAHSAQMGREQRAGLAKAGQLAGYWQASFAFGETQALLQHLFDRMPSISAKTARGIVEEELGAPLSKHFATFEENPIAAASLGQVHRATGWDGTEYAVKVQYPDIKARLREDLLQSDTLERLMGGTLGGAISAESKQQLADAILQELDYKQEAVWMKTFRQALRGDSRFCVPDFVAHLSTSHVLTETYLSGTPLLSYLATPLTDQSRNHLTQLLFAYGWETPLLHGLVNADPNPGNFFVRNEATQLGLVDFGCCTKLSEADVALERSLWHAVLRQDGEWLRYTLHQMGFVTHSKSFDSDEYREWERILVLPFQKRTFVYTKEYARSLIERTQEVVHSARATIPAAFVLLWRQRLGLVSLLGMSGGSGSFQEDLWMCLDKIHLAPKEDTWGKPIHFPKAQ